MSPGRGRKAPAAKTGKRTFFRRRKVCKFTAEGIEYIDYKDINLLRQFVPERAKVLPRRISGNSARHQRMLAIAIQRARHLALLPYVTD
jgi:small subunit ribosomal protein S18